MIGNVTSGDTVTVTILTDKHQNVTPQTEESFYVEAKIARKPVFCISTVLTGTLTLNNSPITAKGASTPGVALNLPAGHSVNVNTDANSTLEEGLK